MSEDRVWVHRVCKCEHERVVSADTNGSDGITGRAGGTGLKKMCGTAVYGGSRTGGVRRWSVACNRMAGRERVSEWLWPLLGVLGSWAGSGCSDRVDANKTHERKAPKLTQLPRERELINL